MCHGMRRLRVTTLSPSSADRTNVRSPMGNCSAKPEIRPDLFENFFAEVHQVHLVHGHDDAGFAQRGDEQVAARLRQHAVARRPG